MLPVLWLIVEEFWKVCQYSEVDILQSFPSSQKKHSLMGQLLISSPMSQNFLSILFIMAQDSNSNFPL